MIFSLLSFKIKLPSPECFPSVEEKGSCKGLLQQRCYNEEYDPQKQSSISQYFHQWQFWRPTVIQWFLQQTFGLWNLAIVSTHSAASISRETLVKKPLYLSLSGILIQLHNDEGKIKMIMLIMMNNNYHDCNDNDSNSSIGNDDNRLWCEQRGLKLTRRAHQLRAVTDTRKRRINFNMQMEIHHLPAFSCSMLIGWW